MDAIIKDEKLKELILKDKVLIELFKKHNYKCLFDNINWWLINKDQFIWYFDGLDKLCKPNMFDISKCKQRKKGFRNIIDIIDNSITTTIIECSCNFANKIKTYYSYYDFPENNLNLNFKNSEYKFYPYREECINDIWTFFNDKESNYNFQKKGIYLHSKYTGDGKTYTFILFANTLAKYKKNVLFVSMSTLVYKIKLIPNNTDEKDLYKMALNTEYLFIDDIGSGYMNAWFRDKILYHILDHRLKFSMPTFFTSNLDLDELKKWFLMTKKYNTPNRKDDLSKMQVENLINKIKKLANIYSWNNKNNI